MKKRKGNSTVTPNFDALVIRRVGPRHFITTLRDYTKFPQSSSSFWYCIETVNATQSVVATSGDEIIGFFRYKISGKTLTACGTWVRTKYRRQGVATKMWEYALKKERSQSVKVITVSTYGRRFVRKFGIRHDTLVLSRFL